MQLVVSLISHERIDTKLVHGVETVLNLYCSVFLALSLIVSMCETAEHATAASVFRACWG
jgi:hypothetical protein